MSNLLTDKTRLIRLSCGAFVVLPDGGVGCKLVFLNQMVQCHRTSGPCPVADLRGGVRDAPPGPNSFNFMQFLGKFGKIVCWRPHLEDWRPLLGEILDPPLMSMLYTENCLKAKLSVTERSLAKGPFTFAISWNYCDCDYVDDPQF